ncbi:kinase phosphorylation protein-domain-containing protein, partial [Tribonema minus]
MPGNGAYRVGGTRGGADQFRWEDVKQDKYRELYLGHSLHAPVGRWQKGKDLTWYAKKKQDPEAAAGAAAELAAIRRQDEDLIRQALGHAPLQRPDGDGAQLGEAEMKALLARGTTEREAVDIERVSGLGAAPSKGHEHLQMTLAEKELARRAKAAEPHLLHESDIVQIVGGGGGEEGAGGSGSAARKAARKEAKRAKKERKREKKAAKKAKRAAKKAAAKRGRSSSSSGSS